MTIGGAYRRPVTTIATDEETPLFLAEGLFYDGQTLSVAPYGPELAATELEGSEVLAAYTLRIRDYGDSFTARMRSEVNGRLYLLSAAGQLLPTDYKRDGSYIVFTMDNGDSLIYVRSGYSIPWWAVAVALAAAMAGLVLTLRTRRKKLIPDRPDSSDKESD